MINFYKYYEGELDNQKLYDEPLKFATPLCEQYKDEVASILHIIKKSPNHAYWYAVYILKRKRWKEAEPYIKKVPYYAFLYAVNVMCSRWKEAESYIKTDEVWWGLYCSNFKLDM